MYLSRILFTYEEIDVDGIEQIMMQIMRRFIEQMPFF